MAHTVRAYALLDPLRGLARHRITGRFAVRERGGILFFFSSRGRHTRCYRDWSSDVCSSDLTEGGHVETDADNDAVLRGCERSDGRLVPFYFANPHADPDDYRRRAGEFRGVELAPAVHGVALNDERTAALVDVAGEFGHPVYLLCMIKPGFNVRDLVELARRFTGVTFVLGHCGFTNLDLYAINAIAPESNIVTDTSGGYTIVVGAALERLGADRVLFGTEYPLQHPSVELAKLRALDVPPE